MVDVDVIALQVRRIINLEPDAAAPVEFRAADTDVPAMLEFENAGIARILLRCMSRGDVVDRDIAGIGEIDDF